MCKYMEYENDNFKELIIYLVLFGFLVWLARSFLLVIQLSFLSFFYLVLLASSNVYGVGLF